MNKCVLITGATSGIGLATAHVFAMNGYDLILTGRREDRLKKIKEEILQNAAIDITLLCFDVRNFNECEKAMGSVSRPVDILINNAGLARGLDYVHEGKIDHWDEMIDTNIKGLIYMTRLVSPGMRTHAPHHQTDNQYAQRELTHDESSSSLTRTAASGDGLSWEPAAPTG